MNMAMLIVTVGAAEAPPPSVRGMGDVSQVTEIRGSAAP